MRPCSIPLLCAAAGAGLWLAGCSDYAASDFDARADDTGYYPGEADADADADADEDGTGADTSTFFTP